MSVFDQQGVGAGDYVSPGLVRVMPDRCFPHMKPHDPAAHPWPYTRREIPHTWYADERFPLMGFLNRDEATLLHNIALQFAGRSALEIGCWRGWSTCHLALAGVILDVVDPALAAADHRAEVAAALACCGAANVTLVGQFSPAGVEALGAEGRCWSLVFIDGDHEGAGPQMDVEACLPHMAEDCAFVFHDLASPDVALGLRALEARGFHVLIYQTTQIMGIAWRGAVCPVAHFPDPAVMWQLPHHLVGLPVSGVSFAAFPPNLRLSLHKQAQALETGKAELAICKDQLASAQEQIANYRGQIANYQAHIASLERQVADLQAHPLVRLVRKFFPL